MQNICTLIFSSDCTVCDSKRRKKLKFLSWNLLNNWQLHITPSYSVTQGGIKVNKKILFSHGIHFPVSLGARLHWALGLNIRRQIMWNLSTNPYLVTKLYWRVLLMRLSSTGALIQDCHTNSHYLECRRCGFPFPCERLDKNQNCKKFWYFTIKTNTINQQQQQKPPNQRYITPEPPPQKALADTGILVHLTAVNFSQQLVVYQLLHLPNQIHFCKEFLFRQISFLQWSTILPENFATCWALLSILTHTQNFSR